MTAQPYVARFTPGPWQFSEYGSPNCWLRGAKDQTVYHIDDYGNDVPTDADARLIAAAPELYEALKDITDCYGVGSTPEKFCDHVRDFMERGRAALAKAVPHTVAERQNNTSNTDTNTNQTAEQPPLGMVMPENE